ncbi:tRNA lysidine(34) synthetase TilS [Gordonia oryzae]|uniref:tRNA(Ile)-lysidine synthase n=1 Tax=Gordonia oryzae TaxID=2487349 RepID=A0A3N4GVM2_9ACTN|nr:tRNA lysidine(34) synthetase TilS [Gordonia oryzae]RPA57024.1 tRNA lysidine(34) synthetase TilS [Gordonia oryzae]
MDNAGALIRAVERFGADHLGSHRQVCVGLSGGPDSLALTAAAVRAGFEVRALVIDHRLQRGSAHIADAAAEAARRLGARAQVIEVSVGTAGGMEAAARTARYAALAEARDGCPVLLGHTADDQAETVLLGLARGSGARSIAGMRAWSAPWGRPLLGIRRAQTVGVCTELGLAPHADAHNSDRRFTRVRLRSEVLPLLDDVVHGGVVEALCRTADALRADTDALDALAEEYYRAARTDSGLAIKGVRDLAAAVRTRVIRRWLLDVGATGLTSRVIGAVDVLAVGWHGQGGVAIGGDGGFRREVVRVGDVLAVRDSPR